MTYNPTTWKDQIVTDPTKYKIIKSDGTEEVVNIEKETGEIIQEGTQITAARLNNIEQGIGSLNTQITELETPLYQTITSNGGNITSIPETCEEGQVNVGVKGRTYTNLLGSAGKGNSVAIWDVSALITSNGEYMYNTADTTATTGSLKEIDVTVGDYLFFQAIGKTSATVDACKFMVLFYDDASLTTNLGSAILDFKNTYNVDTRKGIKIQVPTGTGYTFVYFQINNSQVLYIKEAQVNRITQDEYNNLTENELLEKYPYVTGTKSSINALRLKSGGKNIFDGKLFSGYVGTNGNVTSVDTWVTTDFITVETNETYIGSVDTPYVIATKKFYDKNKNAITAVYDSYPTTSNTKYVRFNIKRTDDATLTDTDIGNIKNSLQIEKGISATKYEAYKETTSYIKAVDSSGNIIEIHSLPNSVKDEVKDGSWYKKISNKINLSNSDVFFYSELTNVALVRFKIVDIASDILNNVTNDIDGIIDVFGKSEVMVNQQDDVNSLGNFLLVPSGDPTHNELQFVVAKGTYTDLADAQANFPTQSLIYQLTESKVYNLNITPLTAYPNGTIIFEKVVPEVSFYDNINGCQVTHTEYPISSIDFIRKVNQSDGNYIELDTSQAIIAGDNLSFTHPDLLEGDLVDWDYYFPEELGTYPSSEIIIPCNHKAVTNSNTEAIQQLSDVSQNQMTKLAAISVPRFFISTLDPDNGQGNDGDFWFKHDSVV